MKISLLKLACALLLSFVGLLHVANAQTPTINVVGNATTIQFGPVPGWNPAAKLSLQLLNSDQTTRTEVWAVVINNNFCVNNHDYHSSYSIVTFPENSKLLANDLETKAIFVRAIELHSAKCPPPTSSSAIAVQKNISEVTSEFVSYFVGRARGGAFVDDQMPAFFSRLSPHNGNVTENYLNKVTEQNRRALRAFQEKQQQESEKRTLDQKAQAFADKHGATGGWVDWKRLKSNPFSYEGKILIFNAEFERMVTSTSGIFSDVIFSSVPQNAFTQPGKVMLAGKVLGVISTKNQFGGDISVPNIRYLGHITCRDSDCDGYFKGHIRRN